MNARVAIGSKASHAGCPGVGVYDEERGWRSPPAEEAAGRFGLGHRVWVPEMSSAVFVENAEFLLDFVRVEAPKVSEGKRGLVRSLLDECPGITLHEALEAHRATQTRSTR